MKETERERQDGEREKTRVLVDRQESRMRGIRMEDVRQTMEKKELLKDFGFGKVPRK